MASLDRAWQRLRHRCPSRSPRTNGLLHPLGELLPLSEHYIVLRYEILPLVSDRLDNSIGPGGTLVERSERKADKTQMGGNLGSELPDGGSRP